jgi:hypothetical protein
MAAGARATGAGALGLTALALPSAAVAASGSEVGGTPVSTVVFDLDASAAGGSPTTVWQDRSGNANNGTTSAEGVTFVAAAGADPDHYRLDGTATVPIANGATIVDPAPSGYTKLVWFRRARSNATDNLVSAASVGVTHYLYFRETSYQRLTAGHNGVAEGDFFQASGGIGAGVWTFGAVTFSTTGGFVLYVNTDDRGWSGTGLSEIATSSGQTDALTAGMSFELGGFRGGNRFQGDIASAVVHSRALTTAEVKAYYAATVDRFHPPASSLVAHLDAIDPGANRDTVWADLSGNANGATPGTGVTFVAAAGAVPAHYSFPGTSTAQRTTVGSGPIVGTASAPPTAYTKMVWFRRDTLTKSSNLASSLGGPDRSAHFLFFPTDFSYAKPVTGHGTSYTRLVGENGMTAGVWTFVAVTFSTSSGFTLHLNTNDLTWPQGSVVTSAYNAATDALTLPMAINIGAFGVNVNDTLDGDVAALVVHARALTSTEVREYHAATSRRFYP